MRKRRSIVTLCLAVGLIGNVSISWAISLKDVINTLETPFQAQTAQEDRIFDYSADFFQESKIASLDRLQRANGVVEVAFDYRDKSTVPTVKFRWRYDQPTTQEIVSDGETMWVHLPENNQVIQSNIERVNRANQNDPMTFLTGLGNLSRDFSINWASPNLDVEGNFVLELEPVRVSSLIRRLIIVVDQNAVQNYLGLGTNEPAEEPLTARPSSSNALTALRESTQGGRGFPNFDQGFDGIIFPILSTTVFDPNGNSTLIEFHNLRVNYGISDLSFNFIVPAGVQVVRPTGTEMGF